MSGTSNGEKNGKNGNGKFWKYLGVLITIFVIACGSIFAYAVTTTALAGNVKENTKDIKGNAADIRSLVEVVNRVGTAVHEQNTKMAEIKGDVKLIRVAVEKMEKNGSR